MWPSEGQEAGDGDGQLEASLKAAFCAELRSLTRLCEQWEVVERFQQVCNVDIFLF